MPLPGYPAQLALAWGRREERPPLRGAHCCSPGRWAGRAGGQQQGLGACPTLMVWHLSTLDSCQPTGVMLTSSSLRRESNSGPRGEGQLESCLLYTSDAADEDSPV